MVTNVAYVDIMKIAKASLLPIVVGLLLVGIYLVLQAVPIFVSDSSIVNILRTISMVYTYLMIPLYILVYFWAGMMAVKKFGLDSIGAGLTSAFAYLVTGLANLAFGVLLNLIVLAQVIPGIDFRSPESVLAASILGDLEGRSGVAVTAICGVALIAIGVLLNFVIGGLGGLFVLTRKR